jgi:hypothetical protein
MDMIAQNETKAFWRFAGALREARRAGGPADRIEECKDELKAIERHSDNTVLRDRCRSVLAEAAPAVAAIG